MTETQGFRSSTALGGGAWAGTAPSAAQIGAAVGCSILAGLAIVAIGDPLVVGGLLLGAVFVAVGMVAPALFLSLVLLARPLLDGLGASTVAGLPSANAAGALGIVVVGVAALLISRTPRLIDIRVAVALVAVIAVSALASTQAYFELGGQVGIEPLADLARLAALLAVFLLAGYAFGDEQGVRRLFLLVALSVAAPAVVGLVQLAQAPEVLPGWEIGRIGSTFSGPVPLGTFLAVTGLILTQMPDDLLDRRLRLVLLAAVLVALVGTYTREGWLIFLLGFAILQWRRNKASLAIALVLAAALIVAIPNVQQRTIEFGAERASQSAEGSFNWRRANWNGLLERYGERPLTGWGLTSTQYVNPRAPIDRPATGGPGYGAHNAAVRALVEGGPLLLAAVIGLFVAILASLRQMARETEWELSWFAQTLLVIWITLAIIAVVSNDPLNATATMFALFALLGAMHAAHASWLAGRRAGQPRGEGAPG